MFNIEWACNSVQDGNCDSDKSVRGKLQVPQMKMIEWSVGLIKSDSKK